MTQKDKDELLNHNYDGIQEYDNDLPRWWVSIFWISMIFAVVYVFYFHLGFGRFTSQKLDDNMAEIMARRESSKKVDAANTQTVKVDLVALVKDQEALARGKASYDAKCIACHLDKGQGLVGPNLTDDYWIHGGKIEEIKKVIIEGVLDKGMLAWGNTMSPKEIDEVTAYVWSLHGSNPAGAKEPQGNLVPRE
jgi:cytochrome c oxidase cbb3-type subunit 3